MTSLHPPHTGLAIEAALLELTFALGEHRGAVLVAPPGTGKSTVAPLHVASATSGRVLVLEPRRIAARAVAARMADLLNEPLGRRIGLRTRDETIAGADSRIEVVTEGVLLRMLQTDPGLSGVDVVMFDEYHERSLDADLGLALCLDLRTHLRPDLSLVVMSATLDPAAVSDLLDGAPLISAGAPPFPVEVVWEKKTLTTAAERTARVPDVVRQAIRTHSGDILVFLPGAAEIRSTARKLSDLAAADIEVVTLHGSLSARDQDAALTPGPPRRVVLASAIAETSLTIPRIGVVVDSGLARHAVYNPARGMSHLVTELATRAEADQRAGRAGRLGPGVAYRLWTEPEHRRRPAAPPPDIERDDLSGLALHLARWGSTATRLRWLDPPPAEALAHAEELLRALGAIDTFGALTRRGRELSDLPLHPRLADLVLAAHEQGQGGLACDIAALAEDRDVLVGARTADLALRLAALNGADPQTADVEVHRLGLERVRRRAATLRRNIGVGGSPGDTSGGHGVGAVVLGGYPDRVAIRRRDDPKRSSQAQRYRFPDGSGVVLDSRDPLLVHDVLVVLDVTPARGSEPRVGLAAPLNTQSLATLAHPSTEVKWDPRNGDIVAVTGQRVGELWLEQQPWADPPAAGLIAAALAGVAREGLTLFDHPAQRWRSRLTYLHRVLGDPWPDLSDAKLLESLSTWLTPALTLAPPRRRKDLAGLDLTQALAPLLPWPDAQRLDELAPDRLEVPSGSRPAITYGADRPFVSVKLQEVFGLSELPRLANGRGELQIHLLSPAGRPVHITSDLGSFWRDGYTQVREELRGRYPKHPWPDDPLTATPTRHTTRRAARGEG